MNGAGGVIVAAIIFALVVETIWCLWEIEMVYIVSRFDWNDESDKVAFMNKERAIAYMEEKAGDNVIHRYCPTTAADRFYYLYTSAHAGWGMEEVEILGEPG